MAESNAPTPSRLLPDEIHQAVKPGTALLRLQTTHSREGILDGAWWPRSRSITVELPALIQVLTDHLGPITRGDNDHFALLAVPPQAPADAARQAMARAVDAGNTTHAAEILLATLAEPSIEDEGRRNAGRSPSGRG